jgi:hypothetical protein
MDPASAAQIENGCEALCVGARGEGACEAGVLTDEVGTIDAARAEGWRVPRTLTVMRHAYVSLVLGALATACGAKTGLIVRPIDATPDRQPLEDARADLGVARDAADVADVIDVADVVEEQEPLQERCVERRVLTTIGQETTVVPGLDRVIPSGYRWELDSRPAGSRTTLSNDDAPRAVLTPDRPGEYRITARVQSQLDAGTLVCPIVVTAQLADPRCPGEALVEPQIVPFSSARTQLGLDPAWIAVRAERLGGDAMIAADEEPSDVSMIAIERAATTTLEAHALTVEAQLVAPFGAVAGLVGRMLTAPDGTRLRRTSFRYTSPTATTADRVRDRVAGIVTGAPLARTMGLRHAVATTYYVELTTALRTDASAVYYLISVAPTAAADDATRPTATRIEDFVNGSGLATAGRVNQIVCDLDRATRSSTADFLWFVDTSGSMNNDQQLVGQTAQAFFDNLNTASVDFRVGVFQAGSATPVLEGPPPYTFVQGTDPMGALQVAYRVTSAAFAGDARDTQRPFANPMGNEEPAAASVQTVLEFERRARIGERNPNFIFRDGAARVVFWVTDEPGTNDDTRFFARDTARWGATLAERITNIAAFFRMRNIVPYGLVPVQPTMTCATSAVNMLSCIITAAGGAFVPINSTNVAERDMAFRAAMNQVVATTAGASSEFSLTQPPISSSIRVRLVDRIVPRSRANGFDYDGVANALVFRGPSFRPRAGDEVRSAYFTWRAP